MRIFPTATHILCTCLLSAIAVLSAAADDSTTVKPKAAVFPLGGNASAALKDHVQYAFRAKLDRQGTYEPIDGPTMADLVGEKPITLATGIDQLKAFVDEQKPVVLIWGELDEQGSKWTLKVNVLDFREKPPKPREITKVCNAETEMRFAIEEVLQTIKGIDAFEHPIEQSVWDDATAKKLWEKNPNLVPNPNFAEANRWTAIYMAEKYPAPFSDKLPAVDKVSILKLPSENGRPPHNVLAMNLSKDCAENNGMACLSEFIAIEPKTRYRLQLKYMSQGPSLHIFVKGYTLARSAVGSGMEKRECYKRQVPPSGSTAGKWVTIVDDMNPQSPTYPVQFLRVDLYAYLTPGIVEFDDIQLKAVGVMTVQIKDASVKTAPKE